jgi:hypothetical protein
MAKGGYKMSFLTRKFNHCDLYYASSVNSSGWIVKIRCDYEHSPAGTIKFFKDDSDIPKSEYFEVSKEDKNEVLILLSLNYPLSQFNDIMSILHYEEKPLYLFLEAESFKGGISTTEEPFEEKKNEIKT